MNFSSPELDSGAGRGHLARRRRAVLLMAVLTLSGLPAAATLTEQMDIACTQREAAELRCGYRLLEGGALVSAAAELNGEVVPARMLEAYPAPGATSAIFMLVDTSDPARQDAVAKAVTHIDSLLDAAAAHHRIGLASFDTELFLLAPVGTATDELRRAAHTLKAQGKTTELYRNVREAVRLLGRSDATRKLLLILSDGLAEDLAYHHEDVVTLARELEIVIGAIGLPRSVGQSVALQSLRRMADETGGLYVQASHVDFSIPGGFIPHLLDALDSGGEFAIDLAPFAAKGAHGLVDVSLTFQTEAQTFLVLAPVTFEVDGTAPQAIPEASPAPVAAPLPAPVRQPLPVPMPRTLWPWYLIVVLLLVLILTAVVVVLVRVRRQAAAAANEPQRTTPLAYLIMQDPRATRHVIDKTPWRIGRSRNADLTLADHSVSRLHAEIRSGEEGILTLNDLESLNGVFVNDNRIDSIQLREGDLIDIGDVRMLFTLHDESYASQEATVLVRTRTPI